MQLKNIKTIDQLFEVGENWYQRAHKLREVWQNENESILRRVKARYLFNVMSSRVLNISSTIFNARSQINCRIVGKYEIGGIRIK